MSSLNEYERLTIADALQTVAFGPGEVRASLVVWLQRCVLEAVGCAGIGRCTGCACGAGVRAWANCLMGGTGVCWKGKGPFLRGRADRWSRGVPGVR